MRSPLDKDFESRRLAAIQILESATPLLLEGYSAAPGSDPERQKHLGTETKSSVRDLVTKFDKLVEEKIFSEIGKRFAGEAIIGEESVASGKASVRELAKNLDSFWIVDPIDGTTNYSRAYPFFCSTLAYCVRNSNGIFEPVVAATWNPVAREMFSASKGNGAWLYHVSGESKKHTKLSVTTVSNYEKALLTTGFIQTRVDSADATFRLFEKLTCKTLGVRRDGSAALDLAYVACGRVDSYWEWSLSPWDVAAGILLVQEAGGRVTHHNGEPIDMMTGEILSSNGSLHDWMISEIRPK